MSSNDPTMEVKDHEQQSDDSRVKSYLYLRTAIVLLLVGLGAAVFYQSVQQDWHMLSSVSAYYYTPAQVIFVGALIGLGVCMVTLRGTNVVEDVFLNLGGILAAVVAIVPTSRGVDYRTAVHACRQEGGALLTGKGSGKLDCPAVQALEEGTRANVENNLVALLIVGALGLLVALYFHLRGGGGSKGRGLISFGFVVAFAVWIVGLVALLWFIGPFIDNAHYVAAIGLFVCVIVVAIANAWRRRHTGVPPLLGRRLQAVKGIMVTSPKQLDRYARVAWLMVVVGAVGIPLMFAGVVSLFWLEIVVALLFAVLWFVQTIDIGDQPVPTST